jgi:predicted HicB family RNase H-like nuclease
MTLTMRTVLSCFEAEELALPLSALAQRLAIVLPHAPRVARLANFLHDVPSSIVDNVRLYKRWDVQEAADVEKADEERAKENVAIKKPKTVKVTVMLRVPVALIARLQPLAEAQGVRLNDYIIEALEK